MIFALLVQLPIDDLRSDDPAVAMRAMAELHAAGEDARRALEAALPGLDGVTADRARAVLDLAWAEPAPRVTLEVAQIHATEAARLLSEAGGVPIRYRSIGLPGNALLSGSAQQAPLPGAVLGLLLGSGLEIEAGPEGWTITDRIQGLRAGFAPGPYLIVAGNPYVHWRADFRSPPRKTVGLTVTPLLLPALGQPCYERTPRIELIEAVDQAGRPMNPLNLDDAPAEGEYSDPPAEQPSPGPVCPGARSLRGWHGLLDEGASALNLRGRITIDVRRTRRVIDLSVDDEASVAVEGYELFGVCPGDWQFQATLRAPPGAPHVHASAVEESGATAYPSWSTPRPDGAVELFFANGVRPVVIRVYEMDEPVERTFYFELSDVRVAP